MTLSRREVADSLASVLVRVLPAEVRLVGTASSVMRGMAALPRLPIEPDDAVEHVQRRMFEALIRRFGPGLEPVERLDRTAITPAGDHAGCFSDDDADPNIARHLNHSEQDRRYYPVAKET